MGFYVLVYKEKINKALLEELSVFFPGLPSGRFHGKEELNSQVNSIMTCRKKHEVYGVTNLQFFFFRLK